MVPTRHGLAYVADILCSYGQKEKARKLATLLIASTAFVFLLYMGISQ